MVVIHADQVESWWSPPPHQRELKVLLSPAMQDVPGHVSIGMVVLPPGASGDPHVHEGSQETWYVVSGKGKLRIGTEEYELVPDTVIVAPQGIEHQIFGDKEETLKAIFIFTPAGPEEEILNKQKAENK